MVECIYCGQRDVDGGLNSSGNFMCIDCIAFNEEANSELVEMRPLNPFQGQIVDYPPECYDVERYKRDGFS